jgi:hypothetical protein
LIIVLSMLMLVTLRMMLVVIAVSCLTHAASRSEMEDEDCGVSASSDHQYPARAHGTTSRRAKDLALLNSLAPFRSATDPGLLDRFNIHIETDSGALGARSVQCSITKIS